MGLVDGNLYLVKVKGEYIVAVFAGFVDGRSRGMDWRWAKFVGPDGTYHIPASDTFLYCREIPEAQ
jgi:hypothetical protein